MYRCLAGIRPDPDGAGYKSFVIKPAIISDLSYVKATYESVYGLIGSSWRRDGNMLALDVTVPPNSTALIYVPSRDEANVNESGSRASGSPGVTFIRSEDKYIVYKVKSGRYKFRSALPAKLTDTL